MQSESSLGTVVVCGWEFESQLVLLLECLLGFLSGEVTGSLQDLKLVMQLGLLKPMNRVFGLVLEFQREFVYSRFAAG